MLTAQTDPQFKEYMISNVREESNGYVITFDGGTCFLIPKNPDVSLVPAPGMTVRLFGKGFGYPVRGAVVDGVVFFYRTPEQEKEKHKQFVDEQNAKKRAEFEKNKAQMDADFAALPPVFQQRIERYRVNNPDFRWDYEPYELFCCKEAMKIVEALKTPEAIKAFHGMEYDEQMKLVKLDEGHSGNTFGCAVSLAYHYVINPDNVLKVHGALAPLVGSRAYGELPNE